MASREAISQEFYNNDDHQNLLMYNVQPTGSVLSTGCGTFGKVEKVKVGHNIYAGKILHDQIYEKSFKQSKVIVTDFVQECKRIAGIDHPNITKLIGTCMLPNYSLPILVMELMDNNLHQYLELKSSIPLVLKQSILEDIAKGLLYLHTQSPKPIVHGDLTAYNILLSSSLVAKITDVGNSSLTHLAFSRTTDKFEYPAKMMVYIPPEFEHVGKRNDTSLDIFSFGHLILFCVIQKFPDTLLLSSFAQPDNSECIEVLSEEDRRREYFKEMDIKLPQGDKNPLVLLSKDCLSNDPQGRPSAENVLARMRQMVEETGRIPGDNEALGRMETIKLLHQQDSLHKMLPQERKEFQNRIQTLVSANKELERKIKSQRVKSEKEMEEKERVISEKSMQVVELERQMEQNQAEKVAAFARVEELLSSITQKQDLQKQMLSQVKERARKLREEEDEIVRQTEFEISQVISELQLPASPLKRKNDIVWEQLPDLPAALSKYPCAVFLQGCIYVGGAQSKDHAHTVFVYDHSSPDAWTKLPPCPRREFGMVAVRNTLVTIGGIESSNKKSTKVTVWDPTVEQWKDNYYPPLLNAQSSPKVILYENWLILIGVNTVEKYDIDSKKLIWSLCAPLPEKCTDISCTTVENTLYVAGSITSDSADGTENVVFYALLPVLTRISHKDKTIWKRLPNIPSPCSTILSIHRKSILALGGEVALQSSLSMHGPVFSYNLKKEASTKWERVGSIPYDRKYCTCLKLPGNRIVVLGGQQPLNSEGIKRVDVGIFKGRSSQL